MLAIFLPPLGVFVCGKPIQALINVGLTILFVLPGMIHALLVVSKYYADKRNEEAIEAADKRNKETIEAIKASAAAQMSDKK